MCGPIPHLIPPHLQPFKENVRPDQRRGASNTLGYMKLFRLCGRKTGVMPVVVKASNGSGKKGLPWCLHEPAVGSAVWKSAALSSCPGFICIPPCPYITGGIICIDGLRHLGCWVWGMCHRISTREQPQTVEHTYSFLGLFLVLRPTPHCSKTYEEGKPFCSFWRGVIRKKGNGIVKWVLGVVGLPLIRQQVTAALGVVFQLEL